MKKHNFSGFVLMTLIITFSLTVCSTDDGGGNDRTFPGKIAVVTSVLDQNEAEFRSAEMLATKYGTDKIIHKTWPTNFGTSEGRQQMVDLFAELALNSEIKAIVINQAVAGTNAAIDKLLETRDDIFIVCCMAQDEPSKIAASANLVIMHNEIGMGVTMAEQAKKQGATHFVHYSFPRHLGGLFISGRRDLLEEKCNELGITFIEVSDVNLDPVSVGIPAARQNITNDVPNKVTQYGKDTAFFGTNCAHQVALIRAVMSEGAIYPQPCCPDPYHGFVEALEIEVTGSISPANLQYVIAETKRIIAEAGMTGRLSNWPVPASMLYTLTGAEYAINWLNNDVDKNNINDNELAVLISDGIMEITGENTEVTISSYSEGGTTYNNFKLVLMDYLDY